MDERRNYTVGEGTTLLTFLLSEVKDKSRNTVKGLLSRHQVMVDGKVVTQFDTVLKPGQKVALLPRSSAGDAELPFSVLFEDKDLVVIDKPTGLLSMGNEKERNRTAYRMVSDYVKAREPGVRIFIVHRLDRDTSGVLVFAKNEKIKRAMMDNWDNIVKRRGYLAAVEGELPEKEGSITSFLRETSTHLVYSATSGKEATTNYRRVAESRGYSLVEVDLETGRKNQIRVHMKDLGCPVAGDRQYGAESDPMRRLALHAHELSFIDPRTKKLVTFRAPLPVGFRKMFPGVKV